MIEKIKNALKSVRVKLFITLSMVILLIILSSVYIAKSFISKKEAEKIFFAPKLAETRE